MTTAFMYDFGNGLEPATKHPNGGGVVSLDSWVSNESYICKESTVWGGSHVHNATVVRSRIDNSTLSDKSTVFDSYFSKIHLGSGCKAMGCGIAFGTIVGFETLISNLKLQNFSLSGTLMGKS